MRLNTSINSLIYSRLGKSPVFILPVATQGQNFALSNTRFNKMFATIIQSYHMNSNGHLYKTGFTNLLARAINIEESFGSKYGLGTPPELNCPSIEEDVHSYQSGTFPRVSCALNKSWVFDNCYWRNIEEVNTSGLAFRLSSREEMSNFKSQVNVTSCSFAELLTYYAPAFWCKGGSYHISDCCFYYTNAETQFMSYFTAANNLTTSDAQHNVFIAIGYKPNPGVNSGLEMHGGTLTFANNNITESVVMEFRGLGAFQANKLTYEYNIATNISALGMLCLGTSPYAPVNATSPPNVHDCVFVRLSGYRQQAAVFLEYYQPFIVRSFTFIKCPGFYFRTAPTFDHEKFADNVTWINCVTDRPLDRLKFTLINVTITDLKIEEHPKIPDVQFPRHKECITAPRATPVPTETPTPSASVSQSKRPPPTIPKVIAPIVEMASEEEEVYVPVEEEKQSTAELVQIGGLVFLVVLAIIIYIMSIIRRRRAVDPNETEMFTNKSRTAGVDFIQKQ